MNWSRREADLRRRHAQPSQWRAEARRRRPITGSGGVPPRAAEELRRSCRADPEAVAIAREEFVALGARHGATAEQRDNIALIISEAVTNAVRHAYPDRPGTVYTLGSVTAGELTILVSDDGVGPRETSRNPGGGWGWPLIAALSDNFTIRRRSHGGTELEMHLRLGPDAGPVSQLRRGSDSSASAPPGPSFSTTR